MHAAHSHRALLRLEGLQPFTLGGRDTGTLRELLGRLTPEASLEVEIDDRTPALR
jgi:hypothetical protein